MGETKTCAACGTEFERNPRYGKQQWADAKYCSRQCGGAGNRKPLRFDLQKEVDRGWESLCWERPEAPLASGYVQMWDNRVNKRRPSHRVYYENVNGPVPNGLELDHLCRNRACCNPDHLEAVTPAVNVRRGLIPKLDEKAAAEIRRSPLNSIELGRIYGVHHATIRAVRTERTWKVWEGAL